MKTLLYIAILSMMAVLTVGCKHTAPTVQTVTVHDTTYTETRIVERDTVLLAPASQVDVSMQVDQLLNAASNRFEKQIKNAKLSIVRVNDTINIGCECDTLALAAKIRDRYINRWRKTLTSEVKTVPEKFVPGYVKILAWIGGGVSLIILILAAIQIIKILK